MTPEIFAHRILKKLPQFLLLEGKPPPAWLDLPLFHAGERILGIYENETEGAKDALVLSSENVYWFTGTAWRRLDYRDICEVTPGREGQEKSAVDAVTLGLKDSTSIVLPVKGRNGRFSDVFEFSRFLMRVRDLYK